MARRRRPGRGAVGADRRGQAGRWPRRAWRRRGFRWPRRGAPPGPALPDSTRRSGPSSPGSRAAAGRPSWAGQGRAPPPRRTPTRRRRRLGAVPGIGGRAPLRVRWPGLGVRPTAGPRQAGRAGGGPVERALRAAFSDASASHASSSPSGRRGPQGRIFGVSIVERAFESCPIMQAYRTSPRPRQAGRIPRHTA